MRKLFIAILLLAATSIVAQEKITILHTNDTHSCIEPEKNGGAGVLNRALLIEAIKDSVGAENVLLFDCGDFSQGSLYYNTFKGSVEVEIMNAMGYDAGAVGNHEFDFGMENLARLVKMAHYPILCANYDFTGTPCEGLIHPTAIIERKGVKIGLFGLSPNPVGLISKDYYAGIEYLPPIETANKCAQELREQGCDVVICLSHLGYRMPNETCDDERLAAATKGIDMKLGGHSHTYFKEPAKLINADGKEVIMQQMNKNGRYLGVVTLTFE